MKKFLLSGFLGLISSFSFGASNGFTPLMTAGVINLGRCHMGSCSWSQSQSTKILSNTKTEMMLEATILGGTSPFDPEEDHSPSDRNIIWNKKPHKVVVYCSHTWPRTSLDKEISSFNFKEGIPGFLESDASLYFEYCHSFTGSPYQAITEFGYDK